MSFYIQPIYSTDTGHAQNLFFNGQLNNIKFDDNYHSLWITGKYWIKSNSVLPAYSYYLDIDSEFGQVLNVPLFFQQEVERVNQPNTSSIQYTINEYDFSFNFNIAQSSHFSEYIKTRTINFHFAPMFNQTVIDDFDVQTTTDNVQKFVTDVNKSKEVHTVQYANFYELNPGINKLKLNSLATPNEIDLEVRVNKFDTKKIFNEFISFKNLTSKLNILSAKIALIPLNGKQTSLELDLFDQLHATNTVTLDLNRYIIYDDNKQVLNEQYIQDVVGIFIDQNITLQFKAIIKFEYMHCIRTIILNQYMTFKSLDIDYELAKFVYQQSDKITLKNAYKELVNEKIF